MDFEIVPDFSIGLQFGEDKILVDAVYDRVDVFRPLGIAIIKLVTDEGFLQMLTSQLDGEAT